MADLETGDIILASKGSLIADFLNYFQSDDVIWGHVLVAKDNCKLLETKLRLKEVDVEPRLSGLQSYRIIRLKTLTEAQKQVISQEAPKLIGLRYGFWRIILQLLDQLFNTDWFSGKSANERIQVCSSYVAWVYHKACDYKFNGVSWQSCEPDDIDDDTFVHADSWITVQEKGMDKVIKQRNLRRLEKGLKRHG